ncbi:hypothetical protein PUR57_02350 [Streptomyces sp. JV176]|uniref:hypothetical protein n=1 Tax=Streptomyces sp. JV176 TaxID=858630 RepID=UPI002E79AB6D|nr:hypothetical protein [Streptomyces sp. JV176]MEE1797536.1 hypothetical protein [Streptomyces sp. JV176]
MQTFDAVFTITQGRPGSQTTNLPYDLGEHRLDRRGQCHTARHMYTASSQSGR